MLCLWTRLSHGGEPAGFQAVPSEPWYRLGWMDGRQVAERSHLAVTGGGSERHRLTQLDELAGAVVAECHRLDRPVLQRSTSWDPSVLWKFRFTELKRSTEPQMYELGYTHGWRRGWGWSPVLHVYPMAWGPKLQRKKLKSCWIPVIIIWW